ncbi:MAG TPA: translation elongation factor Ts [Gemmatimonadetes bacterium]|nr:translation elongation factor Ts [Gemmatimonadota bacterium]|tara:strand:+ start:234 stop:833 length:600 start_codon:yes stop_codon:yes gene_type:complete
MATISAQDVKALRDRTAAGIMDCKNALQEADGDTEKAIDLLRTRGAAKAAKRAGRKASEGTIGTYVHHNGKVAVLMELNSETDFVAKNPEFQQLARDLAMHIASAAPLAVSAENVPSADVERERQVYLAQVAEEGKPENIREKIVEGKLSKWFKETTLLEQSFVKDPELSIKELIDSVSAKTGEKISVARFVRFQVGGA